MQSKDKNENDMHIGATPIIFKRAERLRNKMTPSEKILWEELRGKKLEGYKFRRQHPILKYILDFYCYELKLVIEVDGEIHNTKEQIEKDVQRSKELKSQGLVILRFTNEEVNKEVAKVIQAIQRKILEIKVV